MSHVCSVSHPVSDLISQHFYTGVYCVIALHCGCTMALPVTIRLDSTKPISRVQSEVN